MGRRRHEWRSFVGQSCLWCFWYYSNYCSPSSVLISSLGWVARRSWHPSRSRAPRPGGGEVVDLRGAATGEARRCHPRIISSRKIASVWPHRRCFHASRKPHQPPTGLQFGGPSRPAGVEPCWGGPPNGCTYQGQPTGQSAKLRVGEINSMQ